LRPSASGVDIGTQVSQRFSDDEKTDSRVAHNKHVRPNANIWLLYARTRDMWLNRRPDRRLWAGWPRSDSIAFDSTPRACELWWLSI